MEKLVLKTFYYYSQKLLNHIIFLLIVNVNRSLANDQSDGQYLFWNRCNRNKFWNVNHWDSLDILASNHPCNRVFHCCFALKETIIWFLRCIYFFTNSPPISHVIQDYGFGLITIQIACHVFSMYEVALEETLFLYIHFWGWIICKY